MISRERREAARAKVEAYILHHGLTQQEAAERFGIDIDSGNVRVSEILRGKKGISRKWVQQIADELGISIEQLYDPEETWPPRRVVEHTLLTEPEAEVLRVSHWISRRDSEPHRLQTALDRLMSVPVPAPTDQPAAGPKTPTTGQQAAQEEAAREDGRKPPRRHRGA